eukprot:gene31207-biopygen43555
MQQAFASGDPATISEGDRIRDQLGAHGIQTTDKEKIFRMPDGSMGSYDLYQLPDGETCCGECPAQKRQGSCVRQLPPHRAPSAAGFLRGWEL